MNGKLDYIVKRLLVKLLFALLALLIVACQADKPVIIKRESTSESVLNDPELVDNKTKQDDLQLIEFSLPYEKVVINLKNIPILQEYFQLIDDREKAVEEMNLVPIQLGKTIYLLEFSCHKNLCSYIIIDQSKTNQAYLVADLAKYVYTSVSPDQTTMILKFHRKTSLPIPLAHIVAVDLTNWEIVPITTSTDGQNIPSYKWPISSITWIDETTISALVPILTETTEEHIIEWKNSGSQTTETIFHIEK